MKEAIGHAPLYTFIMTFIVMTFGFLSATLMYYKAFKVNNRIAYAIEEFEGLNSLSDKEIVRILDALGYRKGEKVNCPSSPNGKNDKTIKSLITEASYDSITNYPICIYESYETSNVNNGPVTKENRYFNYGITTYIFFDIPVIGGTFKIPVYSESERIFHFAG